MSCYAQNPDGLSCRGRAVGAEGRINEPHTHGTPHTCCRSNQLDQPLEKIAYGLAEAAAAVGIGVTCLRELVDRGKLKTFRLGRRVLIRKSDLAAFVDRLYCEQNPGGVL